jgi:hypothetical protein
MSDQVVAAELSAASLRLLRSFRMGFTFPAGGRDTP